jgi:hypothetical protein
MRAFIKFNKGMMKMPFHWQLWLVLLLTVNLIVPFFYIDRVEAQVVLAVLVASFVLSTILTARVGFTRLLGLGHILWVPLLWFLWTHLEQNPPDDFFGIWIRTLMTLNAMSLVIDAVDVIRYIAGDREETVKGL